MTDEETILNLCNYAAKLRLIEPHEWKETGYHVEENEKCLLVKLGNGFDYRISESDGQSEVSIYITHEGFPFHLAKGRAFGSRKNQHRWRSALNSVNGISYTMGMRWTYRLNLPDSVVATLPRYEQLLSDACKKLAMLQLKKSF